MGIPVIQQLRVGAYILKQKIIWRSKRLENIGTTGFLKKIRFYSVFLELSSSFFVFTVRNEFDGRFHIIYPP